MLLKTEKATIEAGKRFAAKLHGGDIVLLEGVLGAGKTTFVKGMAGFFGIKKKITSPTFALMNVYDIKHRRDSSTRPPKADSVGMTKLIHVDTYRLKNEQELIDIGIEDYLGAPNTICMIEWPEKLQSLLKNKKTLKVKFEHSDNGREIKFS
jgi:tRNA threonylcarbamoyladenosine biosynthesis protein TsaE